MLQLGSWSESLPLYENHNFVDEVVWIKYELPVSMVAKSSPQGTRTLSSLLQFQLVILPEVREMLEDPCPTSCGLAPCPDRVKAGGILDFLLVETVSNSAREGCLLLWKKEQSD